MIIESDHHFQVPAMRRIWATEQSTEQSNEQNTKQTTEETSEQFAEQSSWTIFARRLFTSS